ncbi:hypothetical protein Y032_0006g2949 [Ancylostoma ceylanicum]|uniref:Uncharacterized protein n=1 Tax=Ancylostoma ceylanicum TaxID=53326 RepID=A0A016VPN7_9BILA|nr:hypothetical protein Y032_0006g2949 [Ancylostoma ceylanicum]
MHFKEVRWYFAIFISVSVLLVVVGTYLSELTDTSSSAIGVQPREVRHSASAEPPAPTGAYRGDRDGLLFHPFDNACKFAMPNAYASDVVKWQVGERLRQRKCPYDDYDFATMDSDGYMYVHPHFARYPEVTHNVTCKVVFLEGGIRSGRTSFDTFEEVTTVEAPANKRFLANGDVFYIRCHQNETQIFQKPYAGIRDFTKEKYKVYIVEDTESFDKFGRRRKTAETPAKPDRYSIDILAFDSTSRTMFMRHMPRTVEIMNKLGYEMFYGYTKIGDNSAVNLGPILAGDIPEALNESKFDVSGDISQDWILPTTKGLDPTLLPFLWKTMKEKFGCRTMFNDDIAVSDRGVFHYPPEEFQPGFTSPPTDHYYRAYYLAVYKNWIYTGCKDGGQIQREFIDIWRRFANVYKDVCHFGFTFITSLTHEAGFPIETLDEFMRSSLENLYVTGALDNTVSVIMGDHGNRVGLVQFSHTGRIEERMPLMAIRLPTDFKDRYPTEYSNFLTNKWKLTSNYDIHQMLKDISLMRLGNEKKSQQRDIGRGISLFDEISKFRACYDAYIAENFCTCLIDHHNQFMPQEKCPERKKATAVEKYEAAIISWIRENHLNTCLHDDNIIIADDAKILGISPIVRYGVRSKKNLTAVDFVRRRGALLEFLYHEFTATLHLRNGRNIRLLFRIEQEVVKNEFRVVFEPAVRDPPPDCRSLSVFRICDCFTSPA